MSKFSVGDIVELDPDVTEEQLAELGLVSQRVFKSRLMEDLREGPWVVTAIPGLQHLRLCGVNLSKTQISSTSLRPSDLAFWSSSLRFRKVKPEWKQTELFSGTNGACAAGDPPRGPDNIRHRGPRK